MHYFGFRSIATFIAHHDGSRDVVAVGRSPDVQIETVFAQVGVGEQVADVLGIDGIAVHLHTGSRPLSRVDGSYRVWWDLFQADWRGEAQLTDWWLGVGNAAECVDHGPVIVGVLKAVDQAN